MNVDMKVQISVLCLKGERQLQLLFLSWSDDQFHSNSSHMNKSQKDEASNRATLKALQILRSIIAIVYRMRAVLPEIWTVAQIKPKVSLWEPRKAKGSPEESCPAFSAQSRHGTQEDTGVKVSL